MLNGSEDMFLKEENITKHEKATSLESSEMETETQDLFPAPHAKLAKN